MTADVPQLAALQGAAQAAGPHGQPEAATARVLQVPGEAAVAEPRGRPAVATAHVP